MAMRGRTFVYQYNGDANSREEVADLMEEIEVPEKGSMVERNGKRWNVAAVNTQESVSLPRALPVYWVFLTSVEIGNG